MRLIAPSEFAASPINLPAFAKPVITALAVLLSAVTVALSYLGSRTGTRNSSWDDQMSAFLILIFLIAPLAWDHHLVYILPALAVVIGRLLNGSLTGTWAACLTVAVFVIAWKIPIDLPSLHNGWWTLLASLKLYAAVLLWIYFVSRLAPGFYSSKWPMRSRLVSK